MQWHKTAKQNILNKKPDLKDLLFTLLIKTKKKKTLKKRTVTMKQKKNLFQRKLFTKI